MVYTKNIKDMRVDNVNQNKGIGYIKFNTDTEMDLIAESMDRLIAKQQKLVERMGGGKHHDIDEVKKLDRFKKSKDVVIEIPKQNRMRVKAVRDKVKTKFKEEKKEKEDKEKDKIKGANKIPDGLGGEIEEIVDVEDTEEFKQMSRVMDNAEVGSGLIEGTEVTHRDIHVLVNAINQHICDMEKDSIYKKTRRNQNKYEKLKQMLENAQQQKAQFERVRPKPKGFGRLRK
jgi:hypothetical protein